MTKWNQYIVIHSGFNSDITTGRHPRAALNKVRKSPSGYHWECHKTKKAFLENHGYDWHITSKSNATLISDDGDIFYCGLVDNG